MDCLEDALTGSAPDSSIWSDTHTHTHVDLVCLSLSPSCMHTHTFLATLQPCCDVLCKHALQHVWSNFIRQRPIFSVKLPLSPPLSLSLMHKHITSFFFHLFLQDSSFLLTSLLFTRENLLHPAFDAL